MRAPFVAIAGIPGSGKTTLARALAEHFDADWIQVGTIAEEVDPGTIEGGRMADDAALEVAFRAEIERPRSRSVIIDGLPRRAEQWLWVPEGTILILLNCRVDIARERLLRRGRVDDTLEIIGRRIAEQSALLDGWAAELAGWERCLNTSQKDAAKIAEDVIAYLEERKREVF